MTLPSWTRGDERRLKERVERVSGIHPADIADIPMIVRNDIPLNCAQGCHQGNHSHAARQVGSFCLCLCLNCPDLVV